MAAARSLEMYQKQLKISYLVNLPSYSAIVKNLSLESEFAVFKGYVPQYLDILFVCASTGNGFLLIWILSDPDLTLEYTLAVSLHRHRYSSVAKSPGRPRGLPSPPKSARHTM
jgi:hypothetical protein